MGNLHIKRQLMRGRIRIQFSRPSEVGVCECVYFQSEIMIALLKDYVSQLCPVELPFVLLSQAVTSSVNWEQVKMRVGPLDSQQDVSI